MYNAEICISFEALKQFLEVANKKNYDIISVTEDTNSTYTIIYKTNHIV